MAENDIDWTGTATAGAGAVLGMIGGAIQHNRNKDVMDINLANSKAMANYNREQQMQLWRDTNYSAQVQELKKAGLSVGMMYGMGGAGGATTATHAAETPEMRTMDIASHMAMGTQLARTAAKTELIKAQTGKIKEETKKTGTEIESLTQGIENQKAQEALTATQTALTDLEFRIKGATLTEQQDMIKYGPAKLS